MRGGIISDSDLTTHECHYLGYPRESIICLSNSSSSSHDGTARARPTCCAVENGMRDRFEISRLLFSVTFQCAECTGLPTLNSPEVDVSGKNSRDVIKGLVSSVHVTTLPSVDKGSAVWEQIKLES